MPYFGMVRPFSDAPPGKGGADLTHLPGGAVEPG